MWIQANNPLYSDIELDEDIIRALPENGEVDIPECKEGDVPDGAEEEPGLDDDEIDEGPREAPRAREQADKPAFESETGVVRV